MISDITDALEYNYVHTAFQGNYNTLTKRIILGIYWNQPVLVSVCPFDCVLSVDDFVSCTTPTVLLL